jgi:CHASE3 domain sensor protein
MVKKNSLSFGRKLGMAFMTMVLLTIAVGGFALVELSTMNARARDLAENWLPSVKTLGEIRTVANQLRRQEADHVLSMDAPEMDTIEQRMVEIKTAFAEKQKDYEALISDPRERAGYDEFRKLVDTYLATQVKLLELSRGGERTVQETKVLFRGESRTAFNAMAAQIGKLVEISNQGSEQAAAAARKSYEAGRLWTLVMIGVAVVLAGGLTAAIVRSVKRELGGEPAEAAALARRVADGDLSGVDGLFVQKGALPVAFGCSDLI